jgi:hypothetical protein
MNTKKIIKFFFKKSFCSNNKNKKAPKKYSDLSSFLKWKEEQNLINKNNNEPDNFNNFPTSETLLNILSQEKITEAKSKLTQILSEIKSTKAFSNDLNYFKYDENFNIDELRKKYQFTLKLYQCEVIEGNKDYHLIAQYYELQQRYERLKFYSDLRDQLINLDKGVNVNTLYSIEWLTNINQTGIALNPGDNSYLEKNKFDKNQVIKQLYLEDQFGDIREPKWTINILIGIWALIGIIVFTYDLKKYKSKLKKLRPGIKYI